MLLTQCRIQSLLRHDAPAFQQTMPTERKELYENETNVYHYQKAKVLNQILQRNVSKTIPNEKSPTIMRKNKNELKDQNRNSHIGINNESYGGGKISSSKHK